MNYQGIMETAVKNGGGEKALLKSMETINIAMNYLKEHDPEQYDCLMRDLYADLYGKHYNKELAEQDVEHICYTDKNGATHRGAHWTTEQIEQVTQGKRFPEKTTPWDRYVAYNAAYADFCKKFADEQILDIAYLFFFADEDWKTDSKIWDYMTANK